MAARRAPGSPGRSELLRPELGQEGIDRVTARFVTTDARACLLRELARTITIAMVRDDRACERKLRTCVLAGKPRAPFGELSVGELCFTQICEVERFAYRETRT